MKAVTKLMIDEWNMKKMDWMGYTLEKGEYFSYHHLIVPKRNGGRMTIDNGAIIIQTAGHDYLHTIENCDKEMFQYLTNILIDINRQRHMPTEKQLLDMDSVMKQFEREWQGKTTSKGKILIKPRYLRRIQY